MMHFFIHKYIFWTKVLNRLSRDKNWIWKIFPILKGPILFPIKDLSKDALVRKILEITGDFSKVDYSKVNDWERKSVLNDAAKTINHEFEFLGTGVLNLSDINWRKDFKSSYIWKNIFYKKIRKITPKGVDIKIPWELSRCHHLLWLGQAYLITNDEKYSKEVIDEIEDWIKNNPFMYSVNWVCSMDVAIRAINWIYAISMISKSPYLTESFTKTYTQSLFQHGFYISNNLEKSIPYSNNHYTSDLVGLLYLGQLFYQTNAGKEWFNFAKSELYDDIRKQVLPSGVHYEKSISYHRLMVELLSSSYYLLKRSNKSVPQDIDYRIRSMYRFVKDYLGPNGEAPLVGDNDDGRLLPFVKRAPGFHGYLLDAGCLDNICLSLNVDPLKPLSGETTYEDAGFQIIKNEFYYIFTSNCVGSMYPDTVNGSSLLSHTHNDHLSFVLFDDKQPIIVDPGTYLYSSDIASRNEFRSTNKHNTIFVDGEEQNILSITGMMEMKPNCVVDSPYEYHTIKEKLHHKRVFTLEGDRVLIKDLLKKNGKAHNVKLSFHFSESVDVSLNFNEFTVLTKIYKYNISFICNQLLRISVNDDLVSPSFGVIKESKTGVVQFDFDDDCEVLTIINRTNISGCL